VLLLDECLLLLFISLTTQSGNFWIYPRKRPVGPYHESVKFFHAITPYLFNNYNFNIISHLRFNIISQAVSSLQVFYLKFWMHFSYLHAYYMFRPSHHSWFDCRNNIWWKVETVKLLIVQFFILFLPLSYIQITSSISCSDTAKPYVRLLDWQTNFHTHVKTNQFPHPYKRTGKISFLCCHL